MKQYICPNLSRSMLLGRESCGANKEGALEGHRAEEKKLAQVGCGETGVLFGGENGRGWALIPDLLKTMASQT